MKKHLPLLVCLFTVVAAFCCACGSDDEAPQNDAVVEDSYSVIRNQICQNFGINSDDYDENLFCLTYHDGLSILSALKKDDNKLLVMAYDTLQGRFLIDECSRVIPKRKTLPYYEQTKEYELRYILPRMSRVGDGYIGFVGLRYVSDVGYADNVLGYFCDGTQAKTEVIEGGDANADIIAWHDNSCLLSSYQTRCVTNQGETKWVVKERISDMNIFPIDYTRYITLHNNNGKVEVKKHEIKDETRETLWDIKIDIPCEFSSVPRLTFDVKSKENSDWSIQVKAVEQNGTIFQGTLKLNVESMEYRWE